MEDKTYQSQYIFFTIAPSPVICLLYIIIISPYKNHSHHPRPPSLTTHWQLSNKQPQCLTTTTGTTTAAPGRFLGSKAQEPGAWGLSHCPTGRGDFRPRNKTITDSSSSTVAGRELCHSAISEDKCLPKFVNNKVLTVTVKNLNIQNYNFYILYVFLLKSFHINEHHLGLGLQPRYFALKALSHWFLDTGTLVYFNLKPQFSYSFLSRAWCQSKMCLSALWSWLGSIMYVNNSTFAFL